MSERGSAQAPALSAGQAGDPPRSAGLGCAGERGGAAPGLGEPGVERRRGFLRGLEIARVGGNFGGSPRAAGEAPNRLEGVGARVGELELVGRGPGARSSRA